MAKAILQGARRGKRGKFKRGVKGAVRLARNVVHAIGWKVLGILGVGLGVLHKLFSAVTDIGQTVRKRAMNDMTYNFEAGTTKTWERFAEKRGYDKTLLPRAAGSAFSMFSDPLRYTNGNIEKIAPYLNTSTAELMRMSTPEGDENVLGMIGAVIEDLAEKSVRGEALGRQYGRPQATAMNVGAAKDYLGDAWGDLLQLYLYEFKKTGLASLSEWNVDGKPMTFANWWTQEGEEVKAGNGLTNPTVERAAELMYQAAADLKGSLSGLKQDVFERIAGSISQMAEDVRAILTNWIAPLFPVFAKKENERAALINAATVEQTSNILPDRTKEVERILRENGVPITAQEFQPTWDAIVRGKPFTLPKGANTLGLIENYATFGTYYRILEARNRAQEEQQKAIDAAERGKNYTQTAVLYAPSSIATSGTSDAMRASIATQKYLAGDVRDPAMKTGGGRGSNISANIVNILAGIPSALVQMIQTIPEEMERQVLAIEIQKYHDARAAMQKAAKETPGMYEYYKGLAETQLNVVTDMLSAPGMDRIVVRPWLEVRRQHYEFTREMDGKVGRSKYSKFGTEKTPVPQKTYPSEEEQLKALRLKYPNLSEAEQKGMVQYSEADKARKAIEDIEEFDKRSEELNEFEPAESLQRINNATTTQAFRGKLDGNILRNSAIPFDNVADLLASGGILHIKVDEAAIGKPGVPVTTQVIVQINDKKVVALEQTDTGFKQSMSFTNYDEFSKMINAYMNRQEATPIN